MTLFGVGDEGDWAVGFFENGLECSGGLKVYGGVSGAVHDEGWRGVFANMMAGRKEFGFDAEVSIFAVADFPLTKIC